MKTNSLNSSAKVNKSNVKNSVTEFISKDCLMKTSDAKKVTKTVFEEEFCSPFKCLHWSNKHKTENGFKDLYLRFNIVDEKNKVRNLTLNDLLNVLPDGETDDKKRVFCKLSNSNKLGNAIKSFVDKNEKIWYYIPIKFSTNDFFSSISSKQALTKKEIALKEYNNNSAKRLLDETKKLKQLTEKIEELKNNSMYKGLTSEQIEAIAREITKIKIAL